MPGSGVTISFIRKRVVMGDQICVIASFLCSGVTFNIDKNNLKLKRIDHISVGARSFTSGDVQILQNIRSATTAEAGCIYGNSFDTGYDFTAMIYGV